VSPKARFVQQQHHEHAHNPASDTPEYPLTLSYKKLKYYRNMVVNLTGIIIIEMVLRTNLVIVAGERQSWH